MAYTAQQLITNAFYLSNILARDLEQASDEQLQDGLFELNSFIVEKGFDTKMIPYYTVFDGNFVIGQEKYFIADLVELDTLTFFIGSPSSPNAVRYSMREETRYDYFGTGRVEDVKSLPYEYHTERVKGGMDVYVYYKPVENYPFQLTGKFLLSKVTLNQDLESVFDDFYIQYLRYGTANAICEFYQIDTPQSVLKKIDDIENHLRTLSPMDFSMRKMQYFSQQQGFNYADANIGRGWRPPR